MINMFKLNDGVKFDNGFKVKAFIYRILCIQKHDLDFKKKLKKYEDYLENIKEYQSV